MEIHLHRPTFEGVFEVATWQWRMGMRSLPGLRAGYFLEAATNYQVAASLAPTPLDAEIALRWAWCAHERGYGRISTLEVHG